MSQFSATLAGELMVQGNSSIDPRNYPSEVFDLLSIPAFDAGEPEVTSGSSIGSSKQLVRPDDVLISKIVPHIRRAWVVPTNCGRRQIASGEWIVFRSERVFPGYLRHVLVSNEFHSHFMQTVSGVGGSLLRARPAHVAKIDIPLPPLAEQRRIADVLDRAETLRAQRRQALAQLDVLAESIFLDMFGSVRGRSKFAIGTIRPYVEASSGKSSRPVFATSRTSVPIYGGNGVNGWATTALYETPVLVFGRVGQQCGNAFITEGPSWVTDNAIVVRIADAAVLDATYVLHAFRMSDFSGRVKHLDLPFINQGMILDTPLVVPPLSTQKTFSARIQAIEALKVTHHNAQVQLDALFASLQHRAFRGEL